MKKEEKTNVMRILQQKKLPCRAHYPGTEATNGMEIAAALGMPPAQVFKTLVTVGHSGQHYVFAVPVCRELELKKAAKAVGEKSIEMVRSRELLPLTGYIHGGCSPIGMKKLFTTVIDRSAADWGTVFFSAGKIGCQIELSIQELEQVIPFTLADLCAE